MRSMKRWKLAASVSTARSGSPATLFARVSSWRGVLTYRCGAGCLVPVTMRCGRWPGGGDIATVSGHAYPPLHAHVCTFANSDVLMCGRCLKNPDKRREDILSPSRRCRDGELTV